MGGSGLNRRKAPAVPAHRTPPWFDDAKLGIFIHWGVFSVPAWAPRLPPGETIVDVVRTRPQRLGAELPYAEWYENALRIPGSPTARHHAATYGDAPYTEFRRSFEATLAEWDPEAWADQFVRAGAGYVVLVTKHHDGYVLWPTSVPNPNRPGWQAPRDVVGELAAAVRRRGLRFGTYYSVGLDWTWWPAPIAQPADLVAGIPRDPAYREYVDAHLRELVERYQPSVMWSDIGAPPGFDLDAFLRTYLARVPDGTINDRWAVPPPLLHRPRVRSAVNAAARVLLPRLGGRVELGNERARGDFSTPEYTSPRRIRDRRWEATRGIGTAFGYNANEPDESLIDPDRLVRDFVDMVAKNGNLLLNVGPTAGGQLQPRETARLDALGAWLRLEGEAIYGTRPWVRASDTSVEGVEIRYTQGRGALYAVLLSGPPAGRVTLPGLADRVAEPVVLVRGHREVGVAAHGDDLVVELPDDLDRSVPAWALRLGTPAPVLPPG